jgi:death-on-curing family protein
MLGAEYVKYLHDEIVCPVWPGSDPSSTGELRDRGLLESAVGRPFQSAFGEDAYPDIHQKAAALFHSLVANHPFSDGNKRTAVLSLSDFLLGNGQMPLFSVGQMYDLAIRMASYREQSVSHTKSFEEAVGAIRSLTVELSDYQFMLTHSGEPMIGYALARNVRKKIRADRRNKLIPPAQK